MLQNDARSMQWSEILPATICLRRQFATLVGRKRWQNWGTETKTKNAQLWHMKMRSHGEI